jgi:hypothetical protein
MKLLTFVTFHLNAQYKRPHFGNTCLRFPAILDLKSLKFYRRENYSEQTTEQNCNTLVYCRQNLLKYATVKVFWRDKLINTPKLYQ